MKILGNLLHNDKNLLIDWIILSNIGIADILLSRSKGGGM